jgi:hypothetical protein
MLKDMERTLHSRKRSAAASADCTKETSIEIKQKIRANKTSVWLTLELGFTT